MSVEFIHRRRFVFTLLSNPPDPGSVSSQSNPFDPSYYGSSKLHNTPDGARGRDY